METATLAGGCFWCSEAIFKRLNGVISVTSGYSGGVSPNPSYEEVSAGGTNHAESIQIEFDPTILPFEILLEVFFSLHDPTTLNRQGNDIGTQYRSAIFFHNSHQKEIAQRVKAEFEKSNHYPDPIVTQIVPFTNFFSAEDHHQNFYEKNPNHSYCRLVIDPKIKKLLSLHPDKLKPEYQPSTS
jgi:peptide-methionine (S)-S-oxide reductase